MAELPPNKTVGPEGAWKITNVADAIREFEMKGKPMKSYRLTVEQGEHSYERVELVQVATTPAPVQGATIQGHVDERHYETQDGVKKDLRFVKPAGAGGFGGGRAWKPRPDDCPEVYAQRQTAIARQHSQEMAIRVMELAQATGGAVEPLMAELGVPLTIEVGGKEKPLALVDAFSRDVTEAGLNAWNYEEKQGKIGKALAKRGG